jgi:hypothetical protein
MELSNLLFWALKVIEFFFTNLNNIFKSKPSLNINMRSIYILFIFRPSSTVISNTDFNLSYFNLSYIFPGHNDSVERGLTVRNFREIFKTVSIIGSVRIIGT